MLIIERISNPFTIFRVFIKLNKNYKIIANNISIKDVIES